jgi:hypothetical protein
MRKPAYLPENKKCACGCDYPARPGSKYRSLSCARKMWARKFRTERREKYNAYQRDYRAGKAKPQQIELIPAKKRTSKCGCGDFHNCLTCRNAERWRAFLAGDVPAYMQPVISRIVARETAPSVAGD